MRLEQLPVQLLVAAELEPVLLGPLVAGREDVRRLRAGPHLRLRHEVGRGPRCARAPRPAASRTSTLYGPGPARSAYVASKTPEGARLKLCSRTVADPSRSTTHPPRSSRVRFEPDPQRVAVATPEVHDTLVVRARVAADLPHRLVALAEAQQLLRLEERVGLLVAEEARLDLEVGALVVGEGAAPVPALVVPAPRPYLLARQVVVVRDVDHARLGARAVDAHERLAAAVDEARHEAREVVARVGEVDSRGVHRPGVDVGNVVGGRELHRVEDVRVALGAYRGRRPPVEAVAHVAAVVERRRLLEQRAAGPQAQLHPPLHPVRAVDVADPGGRAAVRVTDDPEVHRRDRHPVVRDGEVELDPQRHPRPAVGDVGVLDRRVRVEHLVAGRLVDAAVDAPAEVGQHDELEVLVLELERAPRLVCTAIGQVGASGVGVDQERPPREQVEPRVHVRQVFLVRRQRESGLARHHGTSGGFGAARSRRHRRSPGKHHRQRHAHEQRGTRPRAPRGVWGDAVPPAQGTQAHRPPTRIPLEE